MIGLIVSLVSWLEYIASGGVSTFPIACWVLIHTGRGKVNSLQARKGWGMGHRGGGGVWCV